MFTRCSSLALLAASMFALAGCASDDTSPSSQGSDVAPSSPASVSPGGSTNAGAAGDAPSNTVAVEPPPPPCDEAKMAAIQASFDDGSKIPLDVGAVAVLKDPSCGKRYFTRGASKDVPRDAIHLIGSATKTYVASVILMLAEEGKLALTDPVTKWIVGHPGGDAVKVEHLLHHTSGIYNFTNDFLYMAGSILGAAYTPSDLLRFAYSKPLNFQPGEPGKWDYSNTGYVMLGLIIEQITGKMLFEVIRERILTPIGAKATFFNGYEKLEGTFAPSRTFLGQVAATAMHPSSVWGCGNMVATLDDLLDWTERRGNGTFHSPAMQAEMMKGVKTPISADYGAALVIVKEGDKAVLSGNGPAIGHGGDIPGYHTVSYYFPKNKMTLTMVMHSDKGPTGGFPSGPTYLEPLYNTLVDPYFGTVSAPKSE